MSGPKNYTIIRDMGLARLLGIPVLTPEIVAERLAKKLKKAAPQARERAEGILARRAETNRRAIAEQREARSTSSGSDHNNADFPAEFSAEISAQLGEARDRLMELAEMVGGPENSTVVSNFSEQLSGLESRTSDAATSPSAIEELLHQIGQAREEAEKQSAALAELLQQVASWQESLDGDEEVQRFQNKEYAVWQEEANRLLSEQANTQALTEVIQSAEGIIVRAEQIHSAATDLQGKFVERNALLVNIIDSLKSIGFFVSDPTFSDPDDPAGTVILKASKGGEEMTTWVDLTDNIRSHWNHGEQEYCKDSFFDYVDEMKKRGLEVKPEREDLGQRPILKRKGAKDLPESKKDQRGT